MALILPASALADDTDTFENVPQQLQRQDTPAPRLLSSIVSGPKKKEIEGCTRKCVPTCIRAGEGAEGPCRPCGVRRPSRHEVQRAASRTAHAWPRTLPAGSPGLGPISMRKEVVVFQEGFRTRGYCLRECAEVGGDCARHNLPQLQLLARQLRRGAPACLGSYT